MPVIRVSDSLYERLEQHAVGFANPGSVIEKLLNSYEGIDNPITERLTGLKEKPELVFTPNEEAFKDLLLKTKRAKVLLHLSDGTTEASIWSAHRFKASSDLRRNIWSGHLRGWEQRGIVKAEFQVIA